MSVSSRFVKISAEMTTEQLIQNEKDNTRRRLLTLAGGVGGATLGFGAGWLLRNRQGPRALADMGMPFPILTSELGTLAGGTTGYLMGKKRQIDNLQKTSARGFWDPLGRESDSPELADLVRDAERAKRLETAISVLASPAAPIVNPLIVNKIVSKNLENLGVGEAAQTTKQNLLGNLGTLGAALAGGSALGIAGHQVNKGLDDFMGLPPVSLPNGKGIGKLLSFGGAAAGALIGASASEIIRNQALKRRVREAYAAKQEL